MTEKQTLSVDLDSLFPGSTFSIGDQSIVIKPLGIEQISVISKKLTGVVEILSEQGVTMETFNTAENLFKLTVVLVANFPDVISEAANLEIADVKRLPIEVLVPLVDKIIEVNLKSKESLEKNFKSLIKRFSQVEEKITPKKTRKIVKKAEK